MMSSIRYLNLFQVLRRSTPVDREHSDAAQLYPCVGAPYSFWGVGAHKKS